MTKLTQTLELLRDLGSTREEEGEESFLGGSGTRGEGRGRLQELSTAAAALGHGGEEHGSGGFRRREKNWP